MARSSLGPYLIGWNVRTAVLTDGTCRTPRFTGRLLRAAPLAVRPDEISIGSMGGNLSWRNALSGMGDHPRPRGRLLTSEHSLPA